jgi:hypothetical protein
MRALSIQQEKQRIADIKTSLMKCYIAEAELACFLLEKADRVTLDTDNTFRLKWLADRVKHLIREVQASDERYHKNPSDDNVPLPGVTIFIWNCY